MLEQLAGFCPICWNPVAKVKITGKVAFKCPIHGQINFVLDEHPLAKRNPFVRHCDAMGMFDMEAAC